MKIAVLGTGSVGRAIAGAFAGIGHDVTVGTRDPAATRARTEPGTFSGWHADHPDVGLASFGEVAASADLVVNATNGAASIPALEATGESNLAGKVVIDIANPLDASRGMPPSLSVSNTDSLAEQIQRRFPDARVVKTLNTVNASVMVDPGGLAGGDHTVFVSGDDQAAKQHVAELLRSLGWSDILDLGDLSTARGAEMYLPLWLRLYSVLQTPAFSIKVVR